MARRRSVVLGIVSLAALVTAAASRSRDAVTAHEWGTFTTVAGQDGRAIEWLPLGGPTDLPCFVEHFRNGNNVKLIPGEDAQLIDYQTARARLWGKVRMETPVLYFYGSPQTSVNVRVTFPRGLITEWYPHATAFQFGVTATALRDPRFASWLDWTRVTLSKAPGADPPRERGESHYYAARETDAVPLDVGGQREKFLFYRGVANFDVPLSTRVGENGAVTIRNLGSDALPAVVLFERRGSAIGYRIVGAVRDSITLTPPPLTATVTGLRSDLQSLLEKSGLFSKEASAMLETWRDSWFEEGVRVFYLVPQRAVDNILRLTITPAPSAITRVFVGRMEVITPATERAVQRAISANDVATLERYGRFLAPVTDRLLARAPDSATVRRVHAATEKAYQAYVKRGASCE